MNNNGNVNFQDLVSYRNRLSNIEQMIEAKNIKFSKNLAEHEKLKKEALAELSECLLRIERSQMSLADKIATAKEAEKRFLSIITKDANNIEEQKALIKQKMNYIHNMVQQKLNSQRLSSYQKAQIAEYKAKKDKKKRVMQILLIIAAIIAALTVIGIIFLYSKSIRQECEEKNTSTDWKKQKDIINHAEHKTDRINDDAFVKSLLGDESASVTEIKNNDTIREFAVQTTTDGVKTTTYYMYDKVTDTLMSKSDINEKYFVMANGNNYLANYFSTEGGVIISDKAGIEKVVKVGNDTYTYDYNTETIVKNNINYSRYPDGTPFLIKAQDSQYKGLIHLGWGVAGALGAICVGEHFLGKDDKIETWIKEDKLHKRRQTEIKESYDNLLNSNITKLDGMEGVLCGSAIQNLQGQYNELNMRQDMNNFETCGITPNDLGID